MSILAGALESRHPFFQTDDDVLMVVGFNDNGDHQYWDEATLRPWRGGQHSARELYDRYIYLGAHSEPFQFGVVPRLGAACRAEREAEAAAEYRTRAYSSNLPVGAIPTHTGYTIKPETQTRRQAAEA